MSAYRKFLEAKIHFDAGNGFEVDPSEINPRLKDFNKAIVQWALHGGRRAIFASYGLHKTAMQLEIMRQIGIRKTGRPRLIVAPLGVRGEFKRDAENLFTGEHAIDLRFVRTTAEIDDTAPLWITNYESVREGKIDPTGFDISLDEASILRGFGGTKTFREFMRLFEHTEGFRFVATATPSPNEYIELLAYSAFLGVMDVGQAKTRFFKRNGEKADQLTIHPHKVREFWLWVASWAIFLEMPSALGFSDEGYSLPPMDLRWHELPTDHKMAGAERDGQVRMFKNSAVGVVDASREKRSSMDARVAKVAEIVGEEQRKWENQRLNTGAVTTPQIENSGSPISAPLTRGTKRKGKPPTPDTEKLLTRRVSENTSEPITEGTSSDISSVGGRSICSDMVSERLTSSQCSKPKADDVPFARPNQEAPGCLTLTTTTPQAPSEAFFATGATCASVDTAIIQPDLGKPGSFAPRSTSNAPKQFVIWADLNDEQKAIEKAITNVGVTVSSLTGSQDIEVREALLTDWREKRTHTFLSKPTMYGAGINLQQSHRMIFAGIGFKAQDFLQAIHRIHRFGQTEPCQIDIVYTSAEREIRRNLERKWTQHKEQCAIMTEIIRDFGLSNIAMAAELQRSIGTEREEASGHNWKLVKNDCVTETTAMDENSVDLIVSSIPFSMQYEYSPSYNDFGHTDDNDHFWRQMDFIIPQLFRVLKPGHCCAIHVKDRITPGGINGFGFQTVQPFSDETTAAFTKHGFALLARKTIGTDVVRENSQTYRLGWSEQCKDGTRQGAGMPEYVMLFRKPPSDRSNGYADEPVKKSKPLSYVEGSKGEAQAFNRNKRPVPATGYSRGRWQLDANGVQISDGNRLLLPSELIRVIEHCKRNRKSLSPVFKAWKKWSLENPYNFDLHAAFAEELDRYNLLPPDFCLIPVHSKDPEIWTDITRMRTLNGAQYAKGRELHICPMQFDTVDRLIVQLSEPGHLVYDPFSGLGTTAMRAAMLGRRGLGCELSRAYWMDSLFHCQQAERDAATPALFDLLELEAA